MQAGIVWCPHCGKPHPLGTKVCPTSAKSIDRSVNKLAGERTDPLVGTVIGGKYLVTKRIGSGGMGTVFEAENRLLKRLVAIKLVNATASPDAVARLEREALLVSAVQHPNICDVYDVGVLPDASPFIVLERLHGEPLSNVFRRRGRLDGAFAFDIFMQLLSGLQAAHGAQILHRDLKPANVFLVDRLGVSPLAKIVDFGFASDMTGLRAKPITRPGTLLGTMRYMSPEHLARAPLDARADIFAVGLMLYEALAGVHPFEGNSLLEIQRKLAQEVAPLHTLRPDLPEAVSHVVARALERAPADRWQSALELQRALARAFEASVSLESIPPPSRGPEKF